nr:hypothetical protein [uncultured Pseudomonas sp.]
MPHLLQGRVAWFDTEQAFGCILGRNGVSFLLQGRHLLDPGMPRCPGQLYQFEPVYRKNAWWALQASALLPLPDELTTGVPDDQPD